MQVGPVRHDSRGISGRAVDLACRLADSPVARQLLDAEGADLVLVTSRSLYEDVVRSGGKFIDPAHYSPARLELKEGEVTAWFHLPGRPAPQIPDAEPPSPSAPSPAAGSPADPADDAFDDNDDNDDSEAVGDATPDRRTGPGGVHYNVIGDVSHNHHNKYEGNVQIGRTVDHDSKQGRG